MLAAMRRTDTACCRSIQASSGSVPSGSTISSPEIRCIVTAGSASGTHRADRFKSGTSSNAGRIGNIVNSPSRERRDDPAVRPPDRFPHVVDPKLRGLLVHWLEVRGHRLITARGARKGVGEGKGEPVRVSSGGRRY